MRAAGGVIANGQDDETILRIVDNPAVRPDPNLALQVMAAMTETALIQKATTDGHLLQSPLNQMSGLF